MLRKYSNTTLMGGKKTCDKNKAKKQEKISWKEVGAYCKEIITNGVNSLRTFI
jgi:hypothetical protein